jgi:hypothetical protein
MATRTLSVAARTPKCSTISANSDLQSSFTSSHWITSLASALATDAWGFPPEYRLCRIQGARGAATQAAAACVAGIADRAGRPRHPQREGRAAGDLHSNKLSNPTRLKSCPAGRRRSVKKRPRAGPRRRGPSQLPHLKPLSSDTLALAGRAKPRLMLDFATLTGACVYALTDRMSGVFTNEPTLVEKLAAAGQASGERMWPFPFDEDYDSDLESKVADVVQCAVEGKGGARLIVEVLPAGASFEPLMTLYLTDGTDPAEVQRAKASGWTRRRAADYSSPATANGLNRRLTQCNAA